jgi:hypothetical protein
MTREEIVGLLSHLRRLCDIRGDSDGLLRRIKAEITTVLEQLGEGSGDSGPQEHEREPTDREISLALLSEVRRIRRCLSKPPSSRKPASSAGEG